MRKNGFCEHKFRSMLLTGTFTMAVIYIMLLCDNIIAGHFIGESGVAAINAVTPVTGIVTFFSTVISIGSGILYSREIGAMNKRRANEIYGQGLILSAAIAALSSLLLVLLRDVYFRVCGIGGEIYDLASVYYRWTPLNAALNVMVSYLSQMVYTDGDETCNNVCYACQIGGNVLFSVLLASRFGMLGIILGTIIGNTLGLLASLWHFFRKSNTLHFVWHLFVSDLVQSVRFSIVDAAIYLCWAVADYVLIGHVSARYGETGQVTLAVQPLLGTYLGENNHVMIRRLMRAAIKAALAEGLIANLLVFALARQFCGLFGISSGEALLPSIQAVRIVCMGRVFCSAISLMTSYYMLIDHVGLSVGITFLKDGLLYSLLPVLGSVLFGQAGLWSAFAVAPLLALVLSLLYICLRYGKARFPYLLEGAQRPILVLDDALTKESCVRLSEQVNEALRDRGFSDRSATQAALFTEEIGLTLIEKNKAARKPLLVEISLLFEESSVLLIERDSGVIFDVTDPELKIDGLSSFVINGLLNAQKEKAYLTTTGYNRNMIRFERTDFQSKFRTEKQRIDFGRGK